MKRTLGILTLALLLALGLLAGCSDDNPVDMDLTGSDDYETMDFSEPYGGLTISDEQKAFGDDALDEMLLTEDDQLVTDEPLAEDAEVLALEAAGEEPYDGDDATRPRFTFLRLRWGMLRGPGDTVTIAPPCDVLDWTGSIQVDRGIVLVKRTILFERFTGDHIIRPRPNPQTVAFASHTACHYDGLLIEIIERPGDYDATDQAPNRLHINIDSGLYSGAFDVAELANLNEVVEVDDQGNAIQLTGFTLSDVTVCPKGFLSGGYRLLPVDGVDPTLADDGEGDGTDDLQIGTFLGTWTNVTGRIHGFLRGGYGYDADGQRVFYGKYINRHGQFHGLLAGTWQPGETDEDLATFTGEWVSASGQVEGILGGEGHPIPDFDGGFFVGRWTTLCDDQAEDEIQ